MNGEILKNEYCLFENFVPQILQDDIEKFLLSTDFPWYYHDQISNNIFANCEDKNVIFPPGMSHTFYADGNKNSQYCDNFIAILMFVSKECGFSINQILRIRGRLTFQFPGHDKNKYCLPHVDYQMNQKYYSLVYYVNDCDGDTFLFNQVRSEENIVFTKPSIRAKITPKKGNILLFKGDIYHSGNNPIHSAARVIVNYDFTVK